MLPGLANIERRRVTRSARSDHVGPTRRSIATALLGSPYLTHVAASRSTATCSVDQVGASSLSTNSSNARTFDAPMSMIASSLTNTVLQFQRRCQIYSPPMECTNSEVELQILLAVEGDVSIHGPCLVARSVGSEWRTRRPLYRVHPINYRGDQI